jgi:predicted transcriptional regulator
VSQVVTLELSDEIFIALQQQAETEGKSVSALIAASLEHQYGLQKKQRTEADKEAARQRFRRHAGVIDLGYSTGADNESIDADLIRVYDNQME